MGHGYLVKTGYRLPQKHFIIESNLRKRKFFVPVLGIVKKMFKITPEFIDINNDCIFRDLPESFYLFTINLDPGKNSF
jgi:hypothetical protein